MFKKNFINLCNKKGVSPSNVCRQVGIAPATYSCWTAESVPRKATLMRIADYFGVTVESLLSDAEAPEKAPSKVLSPITPELGTLPRHEINLLLRYRSKPELQAAVDKLLDVPDGDTPLIPAYVAAHSEDGTPDRIEYLTPEEVKRLEDAPPVGFDF